MKENLKQVFGLSILLGALCLLLENCSKRYDEPVDESVPMDSSFSSPQDFGVLDNDEINEASGLAYSRTIPNTLWTHNDSGDKARLFLINEQGQFKGSLTLKGIEARDWEDLVIGPGPQEGRSYIYIGEIGDNRARYDVKKIYRLPEPEIPSLAKTFKKSIPKESVDVIRFRFPDGKRDAETLMIDPLTKDLYVLSKREDSVRVYMAPYPQDTKEVTSLKFLGKLHFTKAIAGDISEDGSEILIKNYANVYHWRREAKQSIIESLRQTPKRLPYKREPQGEAIAWKLDSTGYFTLSEERGGVPARLYFYQRR